MSPIFLVYNFNAWFIVFKIMPSGKSLYLNLNSPSTLALSIELQDLID